MTIIQEKLINAYTILVLAERRTIEQVPETLITFEDGTESTIREQVDINVAEKTIEVLS